MENLKIMVTMTDGEREVKSTLDFKDYVAIKELHGVSLVDDMVTTMLDEFKQ